MMKRVLMTAAFTLAVSLILLAASVYLLGTNEGLMLGLMRRYAPPESTGLPENEYPGVVRMMTAYLRGGAKDFQYAYPLNGAETLAFNGKEQLHMADVQALFELVQTVMLVGGAVVGLIAVCLGLPDLIWHTGLLDAMAFSITCLPPQDLYRALRNGLLCVLASVGALALWAAVDFNSLFILFHRIAFTNDLWWLAPRTDLLIRLMPTGFFVAYAAIICVVWAAAMGLCILMFTLLAKGRATPETKERNNK